MGRKPSYLTGYAVVRVDGPLDCSSRVREYTVGDVMIPTAGPSNVTVKEVVTTADEARREVIRLNSLNAGRACMYYWQATHIFFNGGSHGSAASEGGEGQENAEPL